MPNTISDGEWFDPAIWSGGEIPTESDVATVAHKVSIDGGTIDAAEIHIAAGGSLFIASTCVSSVTINTNSIWLEAELNDTRIVNLDGAVLNIKYPGISCEVEPSMASGTIQATCTILQHSNGDVIVADTGFMSASATLRDVKPEGTARAYAEKVSNGVRYHTVVMSIKQTRLQDLRSIYRMASNPYQVLAVTPSCIIKGWIESVVPDASSVGKAYINVKITITEGA